MSKKPKTPIIPPTIKPAEPVKPAGPTSPMKLSDEQAAQVRAAEKHVVDMKCRLANLTIQQLQAAQETVASEQQLINTISELAVTHGIPPAEAGKWNFDTKVMTFTKVG